MHKIGRTIKRRRREGKTDYKARLGFLKSGKPRIIIRKTNRYILGQLVETEIAQDKVVFGVSSKDLLSNGWPEELKGSLKSLPACYLTGYLLGKKAAKVGEGIIDIGIQRNISKSRIYAFVKGLVDSGFGVPVSEDVLPDEGMLNKNEKTKALINQIKEKIK